MTFHLFDSKRFFSRKDRSRSSSSSSDSDRSKSPEESKVEFITEFGGEEEDESNKNQSGIIIPSASDSRLEYTLISNVCWLLSIGSKLINESPAKYLDGL